MTFYIEALTPGIQITYASRRVNEHHSDDREVKSFVSFHLATDYFMDLQ